MGSKKQTLGESMAALVVEMKHLKESVKSIDKSVEEVRKEDVTSVRGDIRRLEDKITKEYITRNEFEKTLNPVVDRLESIEEELTWAKRKIIGAAIGGGFSAAALFAAISKIIPQ